jgi:hypothetical protein
VRKEHLKNLIVEFEQDIKKRLTQRGREIIQMNECEIETNSTLGDCIKLSIQCEYKSSGSKGVHIDQRIISTKA